MTDIDRHQVAGAFCKRYEDKRHMAWVPGPHIQHLMDIADWCNLQAGDSEQVGARLLDNWFDTKWAAKVDYKPKFLAENLGSIYNPVAVPVEEEPDADAINARRLKERRQRDQHELEAKLSKDLDAAVPPPESLEAMMARIGRTLK